jgi:hypothetical protein
MNFLTTKVIAGLSTLGCVLSCGGTSTRTDERKTRAPTTFNCPPPPLPVYRFSHRDLSTSAEVRPLEITLANNSGEVSEAVLAELEANVDLVSWPSRRSVPFSVVRRVEEARSPQSVLRIEPATKLNDGWYAVSVGAGVSKSAPPNGGMFVDGDRYVTRFRIGSDLLVVTATAAPKMDGATMIYLELSEPSLLAAVPPNVLYVAATATKEKVACTMPKSQASATRRLSLRCPTDKMPDDYHVVVEGGIKNARGRELRAQSIAFSGPRNGAQIRATQLEPAIWQ